MSTRYGSFTATKITIETDDGEVIIDREARVTLADRTAHGDAAMLRMLREYAHSDDEMVVVIGVEIPERQRGERAADASVLSTPCHSCGST